MSTVNFKMVIAVSFATALGSIACGGNSDIKPPIAGSNSSVLPQISVEPTSSAAKPSLPVEFRTPTTDSEWSNIPITASFCDVSGTVHLVNSEATAHSSSWGDVHVFAFSDDTQLGSDGGPTIIAKRLECDNGGGTAAGTLALSYLLLSVDGSTTRVLAELPAKQPEIGEHPTTVEAITRSGDIFTVTEHWYRADDPNCCPTGTAETDWKVSDGNAEVVGTRTLN